MGRGEGGGLTGWAVAMVFTIRMGCVRHFRDVLPILVDDGSMMIALLSSYI